MLMVETDEFMGVSWRSKTSKFC